MSSSTTSYNILLITFGSCILYCWTCFFWSSKITKRPLFPVSLVQKGWEWPDFSLERPTSEETRNLNVRWWVLTWMTASAVGKVEHSEAIPGNKWIVCWAPASRATAGLWSWECKLQGLPGHAGALRPPGAELRALWFLQKTWLEEIMQLLLFLAPPSLPRVAVFRHLRVLMEKGVIGQIDDSLPALNLGGVAIVAEEAEE